MITIDMKIPTDCNSCLIRKIMGCKISNESGWLNNRRDERCLLKDVVRCKDCKNWHINYVPIGEQHGCDVMRDYTPPDGYCFKAVKRDV